MPDQSDSFRDFGILPQGKPPAETVRCYFGWGHVFGQYIGTGIMLGLGLAFSGLAAFLMPFPSNILTPVAVITLAGAGVYLAARHDYAWVELHGDTIRAKHLYTRRVTERRVDEIDELITIVLPFRTAAIIITEAWLGRIKGIKITFRGGHSPIPIFRSDPAMTNAKELIEAVMFRMSEIGQIDAEIVNLDGKPLVRKIYWKRISS